MWIWIANKFAKFHAQRLNRSENIPKRFRGLLFWNTLYVPNPQKTGTDFRNFDFKIVDEFSYNLAYSNGAV